MYITHNLKLIVLEVLSYTYLGANDTFFQLILLSEYPGLELIAG